MTVKIGDRVRVVSGLMTSHATVRDVTHAQGLFVETDNEVPVTLGSHTVDSIGRAFTGTRFWCHVPGAVVLEDKDRLCIGMEAPADVFARGQVFPA